jgi:hypothetical protein
MQWDGVIQNSKQIMSTEVTIILTDEAYQQAEQLARLANRDVASVLAETMYSAVAGQKLADKDTLDSSVFS